MLDQIRSAHRDGIAEGPCNAWMAVERHYADQQTPYRGREPPRRKALYRILRRLQAGRVPAGLPGGHVAEPKFARGPLDAGNQPGGL